MSAIRTASAGESLTPVSVPCTRWEKFHAVGDSHAAIPNQTTTRNHEKRRENCRTIGTGGFGSVTILAASFLHPAAVILLNPFPWESTLSPQLGIIALDHFHWLSLRLRIGKINHRPVIVFSIHNFLRVFRVLWIRRHLADFQVPFPVLAHDPVVL